jgi:hypothetical protein
MASPGARVDFTPGLRHHTGQCEVPMTTWEMIAQRARELPVEKQREVLDFVEFLRVHQAPKRPLCDVAGLFKGFDISPEEIDQAPREMWGAFPREDV